MGKHSALLSTMSFTECALLGQEYNRSFVCAVLCSSYGLRSGIGNEKLHNLPSNCAVFESTVVANLHCYVGCHSCRSWNV
eukprot:IDg13598t1